MITLILCGVSFVIGGVFTIVVGCIMAAGSQSRQEEKWKTQGEGTV